MAWNIGKRYKVKIVITEPLLGTVPKNPQVYADYIAAGVAKRKAEIALEAEEIIGFAIEELDSVPISEEKGWTGFHTDKDASFLYDYQIKGFIKVRESLI